MKCTLCGFDQALQLITTVLCVNPDCKNYDAAWSEEKGYVVFHTETQKLDLRDSSKQIYIYGQPIDLVPTETFRCEINFPVSKTASTPDFYVITYTFTEIPALLSVKAKILIP